MNSTEKKDCDSLPTGWRKTSLGELTYQFSKKITPNLNSEYKFIGMDCIEKDTLKPSFLHEFKDFKSSGNFFQEGDVLYGRLRPYLNKVYQAEFNGVASGEFIVMNSTENIVNKFLMYILHSNQFVHWSNALASGDKPRVKYNQISNYPIQLPPRNEQKRIVSKIEKLFSNLDNSDKYLLHLEKQLKRYRQSVLKSAFEGNLPYEYIKTNLSKVVTQISIKRMPIDCPEAHFIGMDCIEKDALKPHFTYKFKDFKSAGNEFSKNNLLYGRLRPYLNKVYLAEYDGVASGEFIILKMNEDILGEYIKYLLHSQEFVNWSNAQATGDKPRVKFSQIIK
ncbi:MAG: Type I restriction-modification system, specificity subunit S (EC [uncultured Sulfurovum sp.]|uniref:Type I restriction-modification system, specificity subunit S (EC) n=1 Tax=uncultured Sulfurovum sp. TaxID=269237 RepID=A0A6S6T842_9BACT|nr:MAG: Type I restriction-modification system, specificity subunit S (EC [uncultured Sulfurovum sp.]